MVLELGQRTDIQMNIYSRFEPSPLLWRYHNNAAKVAAHFVCVRTLDPIDI